MPEKISSLHELLSKMARANEEVLVEAEVAIARCCVKVQSDAKRKFGTYQAAIGPFPAWAKLKDSTLKQKLKAGSEGDDPLIGHYLAGNHSARPGGQLRGSILVKVQKLKGEIGTNDNLAPYHEYGTSKMPPRPFLRPALLENEEFIRGEFMTAIAAGLLKM